MKTANSISKHFTRAHTIYTVAASASTESPVFGEFVRNNQEEDMYDSPCCMPQRSAAWWRTTCRGATGGETEE